MVAIEKQLQKLILKIDLRQIIEINWTSPKRMKRKNNIGFLKTPH